MVNENNNDNEDKDECGNKKSMFKCKYFHQDPDMTPNNYDLYLDYNSIPINIKLESKHDLYNQLKKYLPLSKRIHLNLETKGVPQNNIFNICTQTRITYKKKGNDGIIRDTVVNIK